MWHIIDLFCNTNSPSQGLLIEILNLKSEKKSILIKMHEIHLATSINPEQWKIWYVAMELDKCYILM